MKRKYLGFIIILVVAVAVLAIGNSLGWFMSDAGNNPNNAQKIDYGDFDYSLVGGCDIRTSYTDGADVKYVAPGENMIYYKNTEDKWVNGPLTILNKSTIATNLRVKIVYSRWDSVGSAFVPTNYGDSTADFQVKNASGDPIGTTGDGWSYEPGTGFWNYLPGGKAVQPVNFETDPDGQNIIISSIGYSDQLERGNVYENAVVSVKLTVEAKQADYATWNQVKGSP